jgi:periplasmic divalent cation tolerance protein
MGFSIVYITTKDIEEAKNVGRALVEQRLAACVNCFDSMQSVYWWNGGCEEGREAVCLIKTRTELVEAVICRVKELHSYSVPCIISWEIQAGNPDYLQWIRENTID